MAKKKRIDWKSKALKLEKEVKEKQENIDLMDQALDDARENLDRVNGNADRWKAEAKDAQADLAIVRAEASEVVEELEHSQAQFSEIDKQMDEVSDKLSRYRKSFSDQSIKISRLAEEALIEAASTGRTSDMQQLTRLVGRLEGHLRGIINATGCKHSVRRDGEERKPLEADVRRAREHGSVQVIARQDHLYD